MAEAKDKPKSGRKTKLLIVISVLVLLILVSIGIYFFLQYQNSQKLLQNPTLAAQTETKTLLDRVGRLIMLPAGEQPSIATVSDVTKLKNQAFFANAKNGDKVLIYTKAKKAILYDPQSNKIVEVTILSVDQSSPSTAKAQPAKVVLYNGTTVVGLTTTIEKQLKDKNANVVVLDKVNARKTTYTKTLVVDLTVDKAGLNGKQTATVKELATMLGGEVNVLPQGEIAPKDAEILVILGK